MIWDGMYGMDDCQKLCILLSWAAKGKRWIMAAKPMNIDLSGPMGDDSDWKMVLREQLTLMTSRIEIIWTMSIVPQFMGVAGCSQTVVFLISLFAPSMPTLLWSGNPYNRHATASYFFSSSSSSLEAPFALLKTPAILTNNAIFPVVQFHPQTRISNQTMVNAKIQFPFPTKVPCLPSCLVLWSVLRRPTSHRSYHYRRVRLR